ncbi:MAG: glycosyltransferase family protein [Candidatus Marinimicrobia bacterium]|jgi:uncharacterized protein (TIGR00661 family)|nr:glycosyltransferase family protein [Candidatus Neomarinimicrobiota bacterium]MDP7127481.1 glycosyltransferase family protein [Candidatus Neomarinimicrobiota bacterium]MDP7608230.1 glycosyltransferase family protein [Candidatus Neomarinimicrobiota bacterium]|tara:strand:- start:3446 stop:4525 length:1080 start_codon:yes stop_codon:yes gene_type:complete
MPKNKRILFAIMGWGLGHATRCIPIIKSLIKDNHVILASNGISALLLQQEFPTLKYIDYPDYAVKYPKNRIMLLPFITFQLPSIIIKLIKEYNQTQHVVKDEKIDIIISDSRYGTFSKGIPTFFIMHQLRFKLDGIFKTIEFLGEWFNYFMFKKYTEVIIPDVKMIPNLTGDLTHSGKIARHPKLHYLGVFCSVSKLNIKEDIDYLFSVSGPEVQRTLFENIILDQIKNIQGKKVVVLGKPEGEQSYDSFENTEIYNHVNRQKQNELLNRSKFVVCRSGYTTVMELVALKKPALMIPTPGQTEQEYLAHHYSELGLFFTANQSELDLLAELNKIHNSERPSMDHIPVNDSEAFSRLLSH